MFIIMKTQDIYIAHPQSSEQATALKAFMQALKIEFEVRQKHEYNSEFLEKILESKKQISNGEFTDVKAENIRTFIDSL